MVLLRTVCIRIILCIHLVHLSDEIINEQMINSKDFSPKNITKNINSQLLTCYNNLNEIFLRENVKAAF